MTDFGSQCSTAYPCRIKAEAAASLPTVPSFLYAAQAGFLQSITRDSQAGLDRNPLCACIIHHMKDAEINWLFQNRLCVTMIYVCSGFFPCKSRLPKCSQPNNKKNSVLIHAWTFAEPKKIHLFDGRRKCGTYYQKKTSREVFIHVSEARMSKTKVFKSAHTDKNVWRERGQRQAAGFPRTFALNSWSCATYGPNSVNRKNSVLK